jgi:hypothetical protein
MAVIVTPGAVDADSYADAATATAYATSRGLAFSGDADALDAALRRATGWLDSTYRSRFPGQRENGRAQALEWPRKAAYDTAGDLIAVDIIPDEVVSATIEAAVRELATPGGLSPDVTLGGAKVLTQVDKIAWEVVRKPSTADDYKPTLTIVDGILAPLIGSKTNTKRLLRS